MRMTSQPDEVRLIEAQAAPARFARGSHCLGLIRDFGDGMPHGVNAFGQKLVLGRSALRESIADAVRRGDLPIVDEMADSPGPRA